MDSKDLTADWDWAGQRIALLLFEAVLRIKRGEWPLMGPAAAGYPAPIGPPTGPS